MATTVNLPTTVAPAKATTATSTSTSTDSRFKSPLRQNGFTVYSADNSTMTSSSSSSPPQSAQLSHLQIQNGRSRTSTASSNVTIKEHVIGTSVNGSGHATGSGRHDDNDNNNNDVEMGEVDDSQNAKVSIDACRRSHSRRSYAPSATKIFSLTLVQPHFLRIAVSLQPIPSSSLASSAMRPLPIPRSNEPRSIGGTTASQTPSEVATPPDAMLHSSAAAGLVGLKTPSSHSMTPGSMRLPSLSALSPRQYSSTAYQQGRPTNARNGSISGSNGSFPIHYSSLSSSARWSPNNVNSSDPHLYSISSTSHGSSYPYSSVKPYMSTSFKTSAERSGSSLLDDDDDHDEDVFGHTASSLGLQDAPRGRARAARGAPSVDEDMDAEGDASGVFSFSSPYLRPQSVDDSVPGLPPSPPESTTTSGHTRGSAGAPPDRILSPSVTARSLQKLSLGGGIEMTNSPSAGSSTSMVGASRRQRPSFAHHSQSAAPSAYSRSLPSGSAALQQNRRLSSSRIARPAMPPSSVSAYSVSPSGAATAATFGNATLYSRSPSGNSPYGRSPAATGGFSRASPYNASGRVPTTFAMDPPTRRERSTSRSRWATPKGSQSSSYRDGEDAEVEDEDDDATDDEMIVDPTISRPSNFAPSSMPVASNLAAMAAAAASAAAATATGPSSVGTRTVTQVPRNVSSTSQASIAEGMEEEGSGPSLDEMTQVAAIRDRLGGAANCAAFIAKLWFLVVRPARYGKYLHWNSTGTTVILSTDPDISNEFASEVLPRLWNHANYSSFIRQMNLYGFQRLPSSRILDKAEIQAAVDAGMKGPDGQSPTDLSTAQQLYGSHSSFLHPKFVRGREDLLPMLKPRNAKRPKASAGGGEVDE